MKFALDAGKFPAPLRRKAWRDIVCNTYVNVDSDHAEDDFRSTIRGHVIDDLMLTRIITTSRHHVERSPTLIKKDGQEVLFFGFVASGQFAMMQSGREATIEAGGIAFHDASRPFQTSFGEDVALDWLSVPKKLFGDRIRSFEDLTATAFHPTTPVQQIAFDFFTGLGPVLDRGVSDGDATALVDQGLDLLAMMMGGSSSRVPVDTAAAALQASQLRRLKSHIDGHLHRADLTLPMVAFALSISPAEIDALFAREDTSFDRFLLERRLDGCRAFLSSATALISSPEDAAALWGFADIDLFTRAFKVRFGSLPHDVIAASRTSSSRATDDT